MANRRQLKKDINFFSNEIITECYAYSVFFPEISHEELEKILNETWDLRKSLIHKINNEPKNNGENKNKTYFNEIAKEFSEKINGLIVRLGNLEKK